MKIQHTLKGIVDYIDGTRRVGHTTAMIRGAQNVDAVLILADTLEHAKVLKDRLPNAIIRSRHSPSAFAGVNAPLMIDNVPLRQICKDALDEIKRLESRVEELERKCLPSEPQTVSLDPRKEIQVIV